MYKSINLSLFLIVGVGFFLSLIIFFEAKKWEEQRIRQNFEVSSLNRLSSFKTDIVRHQEIVNSVANLFISSEYVTRREFKSFVANTLKYDKNIVGLSWNPLIKKEEREDYENRAFKDGINDFELTDLDDKGNRIKSPTHESYIAVFYIEPYLENRPALGLNIATNPARMKAIHRAIDTGKTVITERIKIVQKRKENFGYLMLKAVYKGDGNNNSVEQRRKNFVGLSVGVFTFKDWIPNSMRDIEPIGIDILITDTTTSSEPNFLHFHSSRIREVAITSNDVEENTLYVKSTVDVLGREWTFLFTPAPKFLENNKHWQSWVLLSVGIVITLLLAFLIFTRHKNEQALEKERNMLENLVFDRTKDLLKSKEDVELINNELKIYKDELEIKIAEEIEKNKKQAAFLVEQSRLAQMGELLSMIAHQWRQPLGAIAAITSNLYLKTHLDQYDLKDDKHREEFKHYFLNRLEEIATFVKTLTTTINDFKDFYKPDKEKKSVCIKDPITKALAIIKDSLITSEIEVVEEYVCELNIQIHSNEIMQVILNILKNSQDNFIIKKVDNPIINIKITEKEDSISVAICDNGGGISEDILPNIFDPYFSTKDEKNGTGLGLYMSKIIIEDHHKGTLLVKNTQEGVCFTIDLKKT